MTDELAGHGSDADDAQPSHGRAVDGKGAAAKRPGKGGGIFSGPHRDEILVISSVALVILGYLTLRGGGKQGSAAAQGTQQTNGLGLLAGGEASAIQGLMTQLQNQSDALGNLQATVDDNIGGGGVPDQSPSPFANVDTSAPGGSLAVGGVRTFGDVLRGAFGRLTLQSDNNLVEYDNNNNVVWSSGTTGSGGSFFVNQRDGNNVLYRADGTPVWQSGTAGREAGALQLQADGNIVDYGQYTGSPVWSSMYGAR